MPLSLEKCKKIKDFPQNISNMANHIKTERCISLAIIANREVKMLKQIINLQQEFTLKIIRQFENPALIDQTNKLYFNEANFYKMSTLSDTCTLQINDIISHTTNQNISHINIASDDELLKTCNKLTNMSNSDKAKLYESILQKTLNEISQLCKEIRLKDQNFQAVQKEFANFAKIYNDYQPATLTHEIIDTNNLMTSQFFIDLSEIMSNTAKTDNIDKSSSDTFFDEEVANDEDQLTITEIPNSRLSEYEVKQLFIECVKRDETQLGTPFVKQPLAEQKNSWWPF